MTAIFILVLKNQTGTKPEEGVELQAAWNLPH